MPKVVYVIAGPNGAGKTTSIGKLIPRRIEIINVDLIHFDLFGTHESSLISSEEAKSILSSNEGPAQEKVMHSIMPKPLHFILPKMLHSILPKSLHFIIPKLLHSILPKLLHSILPKLLHSILPKLLHTILPKSLLLILPKMLHFILRISDTGQPLP